MNIAKGNIKLPIVATLISLVAFVILLCLGFWQLDRAEQKRLRLQQIEQRKQQQDINLADILSLRGDIRDYPVTTSGHFDLSHYFLIDNRVEQGRTGYHVVGILNTNSGNVAVNLGWLPANGNRDSLPEFQLPKGLQKVNGIVALPSLNPMISETVKSATHWPVRIQQLDLTVMQNLSAVTLLPMVILATPDSTQPLIRKWQAVVMPAEKHIAYAIQWFGLAIALVVVFVVALMRKNRDVNNEQ